MVFDIYVAGPIAGYKDRNEEAFRAVEKYVEERMRLTALIPHDISPYLHEGPCPEGFRCAEDSEHSECCYARNDLVYMLRDCLSVLVLPKWQPSVGSRLEVITAAQTGMPMRFMDATQLYDIMYNGNVRNNIIQPPDGLDALRRKGFLDA
jgi:hypothetical protein